MAKVNLYPTQKKFSKAVILFGFGLFALVNNINADCGTCSTTTSAACINETFYDYCYLNKKLNHPIPCEEGKVCTTEAGICKTPSDTVKADCQCNMCLGTTLKLACVSATEFVYCDTSTALAQPNAETLSCPPKTYCNIKAYGAATTISLNSICTSSCTTSPTCPVDVELNPTEEYTKSCVGITTPGAYPNTSDPTCKTYVYCEKYGSTMYSLKYTCPSGYFNKEEKTCVATRPGYCKP